MHSRRRFITLPLSANGLPSRVPDFTFRSQARHLHPAVSSSSSYGLVVHLLLLPTTHRCVAVTFSYRPESVCLERTSTSLYVHAPRRASGESATHREPALTFAASP